MARRFLASESQQIVIVLSIGFLLRLAGVISRPVWYDEAFAVLFSEKGPAAMVYGTLAPAAEPLSGAAADVHPLGYYTLLWGWMRIFGESVWAVRGLSIIAGMGVILLAYWLAKSLFGSRSAPLLALFVALSPFQIHYSQEIRMYAWLAVWLCLATLALWRALHGGRWAWWLVFSITSALAQYTQNLAVFYLIPLALTPVLLRRWRAAGAVFLAGIGAVGLYLPWLVRLPEQVARIQRGYWIERPSPARLVSALLSYVTNLPVPSSLIPLALFITLFAIILAAWQTLRDWRSHQSGYLKGVWLAYLAFGPMILLFLFSQIQPVFIERALLPSGVMFALWLGWSFTQTDLPAGLKYASFGLLLTGVLLGFYQHLTYRGFPYGPYQALDASLERRMAASDAIVHSNKLTYFPAVYYDRSLSQTYIADPPASGSDTLAKPTQEVLGLFASPDIETAVGDAHRVYFIIFTRAIDEYLAEGFSTHPHLDWLGQNFRLIDQETWNDIFVYVYER